MYRGEEGGKKRKVNPERKEGKKNQQQVGSNIIMKGEGLCMILGSFYVVGYTYATCTSNVCVCLYPLCTFKKKSY